MQYTTLLLPLFFGGVALSLLAPQANAPQTNSTPSLQNANTSVSNSSQVTTEDLVATVYGLAQTVEDLAAAVQYLAGAMMNGTIYHTSDNGTASNNETNGI